MPELVEENYIVPARQESLRGSDVDPALFREITLRAVTPGDADTIEQLTRGRMGPLHTHIGSPVKKQNVEQICDRAQRRADQGAPPITEQLAVIDQGVPVGYLRLQHRPGVTEISHCFVAASDARTPGATPSGKRVDLAQLLENAAEARATQLGSKALQVRLPESWYTPEAFRGYARVGEGADKVFAKPLTPEGM